MIRYAFLWLRGRWRMWWGVCPLCNSDAPALYRCRVCEFWEPPWRTLGSRGVSPDLWWDRYLCEICQHRWIGHVTRCPGEPDDYIESCAKCGAENPGSWVE